MFTEDIALREKGNHYSFSAVLDRAYGDLICLKEDEHFIKGTEGDLIPPLACGFHKASPNILAVAEEEGRVIIYDTDKLQLHALKRDWEAHKNAIFDLHWVPGKNQLVTASGDLTVALWDVETEQSLRVFRGHSNSVKTVRYHEDEQFVFASGARDGSIMLWDTRVNTKSDFSEPINMLQNGHLPHPPWQPRSTGKRGCGSRMGDIGTEVGQRSITSLIFREKHQLISASSVDGAVKIWDTRKTYTNNKNPLAWHTFPFPGTSAGAHVRCFSYPGRGFASLILDYSKTRLFANCMDNTIYQYDCAAFQQKPVAAYRGHRMQTFYIKLAASPCGTYLLSGSSDGMAYIWHTGYHGDTTASTTNIPTTAAMLSLSGHQGEVSDVAWCVGDPLRVITSSDDGTMRVWRVQEHPRHSDSPGPGGGGPNEEIGRVVGKAQWIDQQPMLKTGLRKNKYTFAPFSSKTSLPTCLRSPIKGTTLPPVSPPGVSPAVQKSLVTISTGSGSRSNKSLMDSISSKSANAVSPSPVKFPTQRAHSRFKSLFKPLTYVISPFKSPFTSPQKITTTSKKTPDAECVSEIKALSDSSSKIQNVELAQRVKRKLFDMESPSLKHAIAKKTCCSLSSSQGTSDCASARKSLFGGSGHKKTPDVSITPKKCVSNNAGPTVLSSEGIHMPPKN